MSAERRLGTGPLHPPWPAAARSRTPIMLCRGVPQRRLKDTRRFGASQWWGSSVNKANGRGSSLSRCQKWWVFVGSRETEFCFEVLGSGECFEGHEVEPDSVIDEACHRPCQFSQREEVDRLGKLGYRRDRRGSNGWFGAAEGAGEDPDHGSVTNGPTKTVIPKAGCEDSATGGAQVRRFVVEQEAQQQMIVDYKEVVPHARSASSAAAAFASLA